MRPAESEWNVPIRNVDRMILEHIDYNEDGSPLLTGSEHIGSQLPNCGMLSSPLCNNFFQKILFMNASLDIGAQKCSGNTRKKYTRALLSMFTTDS